MNNVSASCDFYSSINICDIPSNVVFNYPKIVTMIESSCDVVLLPHQKEILFNLLCDRTNNKLKDLRK